MIVTVKEIERFMNLKAKFFISEGNRYYTNTTYKWYEDNSVTINVISGDDDWDIYSGTDLDETTRTTFDKLPENIQKELLNNINKQL